MNPQVLTAIIALSGVIISALVSYLVARITSSRIKEKTLYEFESTYIGVVTKERFAPYRKAYFLLSELWKDLNADKSYTGRHGIPKKRMIQFIQEYDRLNSEIGVLFSGQTGHYSHKFRLLTYKILRDVKEDEWDLRFNEEYLSEWQQIGLNLESSLKSDLGVYILEHKDFQRKMNIRTYEELVRKRLEKENENVPVPNNK